jgi:hypothetical protein
LTSLPAFGFRPVPDIGVLFGAFEEFIARIALQNVSAFLKINHAIAARQESARPRLKSYLKHVILLWRMKARPAHIMRSALDVFATLGRDLQQ